MSFNWKDVIAPVAGIGAGLLTGNPLVGVGVYSAMSAADAASDAQESANRTNIDLQREDQSWQERLAGTAHQREVVDLRKAGLNPILSTHGGAVTPSVPPARVESVAPYIMQGNNQRMEAFNSALQYKLNVENLKSQIATQKSQVLVNSAQAVQVGEQARRTALENDVLEQESSKRRYEEKRRVERPNWIKNLGIDVQDSIGTVLSPVIRMFK